MTSFDDCLVLRVTVMESAAKYREKLSELELELLLKAGWDPSSFEDDNSYLEVCIAGG